MKISFIVFLVILINGCSNAQNSQSTSPRTLVVEKGISYDQWKKDAESDFRLYPKFGNVKKDEAHKAADQALIDDYTKQAGSRRSGSETLVDLGFRYLYRGDTKTAMYRFNQAWLVDPTNENSFWGFAAVYFTLGDLDSAMRQLKEGLALNPRSSNILTDIASIHMASFESKHDKEELSQAINIFKQSYAIDPKNQNTLYKMSIAYFMQNDCANAARYYKECKSLGGKPITEDFVREIESGCKIK
jgi:tetratricopeptide (TPR) repeat protein